jgi:hypothetical protein
VPEPLHRTTAGRGAAEGLRRDARPRLGIGHRRRRCQRGRSRAARRTRDSADESMGLIETFRTSTTCDAALPWTLHQRPWVAVSPSAEHEQVIVFGVRLGSEG